ncbi:MAG TPA: excinuclease ABC subunit UvrC [Candidatus Tyrphobacter sp.]|nr:excinuclease ABC subunit UvrC [Candidatus Tyrphobacter sp.]
MAVSDYKSLPQSPGVYLMKNASGRVIYVGKAVNLRRRVASYFLRTHDSRIEKLVGEIRKIDYLKTETAIEALILESKLIKDYAPPYNIREKDDKSFLYVRITKEKFPRVLLVRGKDRDKNSLADFGPFTSASSLREALKIVRRIFPYSLHTENRIGTFDRPCFDYELGLCPGVCVGAISRQDYLKNIRNIRLFFAGRKKRILVDLTKEMKTRSGKLDFEAAAKIRRQIFALKHIEDVSLITDSEPADEKNPRSRIEGYDISDISGSSAVGSMVVMEGGKLNRNEYRKFRIKTISQANDVAMLREVLKRRLGNPWPLPDLILVDGGLGQVNALRNVLDEAGLNLPVVGLAKGPERKRNDLVGRLPKGYDAKELIQLRDEAHRFAQAYHRDLRKRKFLNSAD